MQDPTDSYLLKYDKNDGKKTLHGRIFPSESDNQTLIWDRGSFKFNNNTALDIYISDTNFGWS